MAQPAESLHELIEQLLEGKPRGAQTALAAALQITGERLSRFRKEKGESLSVVSCLRLAKYASRAPGDVFRLANKKDEADLLDELYGQPPNTTKEVLIGPDGQAQDGPSPVTSSPQGFDRGAHTAVEEASEIKAALAELALQVGLILRRIGHIEDHQKDPPTRRAKSKKGAARRRVDRRHARGNG